MNCIPYVWMAGRAKGKLPGGSLKYLFVYSKGRLFKCSYSYHMSSHSQDSMIVMILMTGWTHISQSSFLSFQSKTSRTNLTGNRHHQHITNAFASNWTNWDAMLYLDCHAWRHFDIHKWQMFQLPLKFSQYLTHMFLEQIFQQYCIGYIRDNGGWDSLALQGRKASDTCSGRCWPATVAHRQWQDGLHEKMGAMVPKNIPKSNG